MLRTIPFAHRILLLGLVCALVLIGASTLAGAALAKSSAGKFSARFTQPYFTTYQTKTVKLVYKFRIPSKSFSYRLTVKKGGRQLLVKSVKKRGTYSGRKTMTVAKLFAGSVIKVGYYQLQIASDHARNQLNFKIVPFYGRLTKKSFTISEARLVKLIYAFSKPSKRFSYQLRVKKGTKWLLVNKATKIKKRKRAYFVGMRKATLKSLFGKKPIRVGAYQLKVSCAYSSSHWLNFKVVKGPAGGGSNGGSSSASGSGSGTANSAITNFSITGNVVGLEPGLAKPIKLTLTNPNSVAIHVTRLTVTVSADSTPSGCPSATNLRVIQSNISDSSSITVPAKKSVTLASAPRAPQITLINLPDVNQDACKNVRFGLTFSGSAHS